MNTETHIKQQLMKFNMYGLLKNLRFFDPFLLLYLIENDISFGMIGVLFAIREAIVYIFEIPSGIIADQYGKKTELIASFLFYICSFVLFFLGGSILIFILAFIVFGFGEAFRTGTHKAIIIDFMEYHNITTNKSVIYGKTRSYSLIGSSISSLLSVVLIIYIKEYNILFLIAIIPYIIDMFLIFSYPGYLNFTKNHKFTFREFYNGTIGLLLILKKDMKLRGTLIDSSLYNGIFKTVKDYIQVILFPLLVGVVLITSQDEETNNKVVIGIVYAVIYFVSSYASKNAHRFKGDNYNRSLPFFWIMLFIVSAFIVILEDQYIYITLMFLALYIIQNIRKPIMVEKIGDIADKNYRASVLSVESQLTSIVVIIFAPVLGFIFDHYGFSYVFIIVALLSLIMYKVTKK